MKRENLKKTAVAFLIAAAVSPISAIFMTGAWGNLEMTGGGPTWVFQAFVMAMFNIIFVVPACILLAVGSNQSLKHPKVSSSLFVISIIFSIASIAVMVGVPLLTIQGYI